MAITYCAGMLLHINFKVLLHRRLHRLVVLPVQQAVGCEGGVVRMDDCLAVVEEVHIRDQPNGFFTVHDEAELVQRRLLR